MKLCKYCKKYYPESDFGVAVTTEKKVYRRHKCRYCYRKAKKQLWKRYQKWLNDYKKQHHCSQCGNKDYRVLEFHHAQGKELPGSLCTCKGHSFKKIKSEVRKCIILCENCHRILHHQEKTKKFEAKTRACKIGSKMVSYNKKKGVKVCRYCKKSYPETDFYIAKEINGKVYRRHKCKYCYYITKHKLRIKRQKRIDNFKKKTACKYCGFSDYRALEFHHLHNKKFNISTGISAKHFSIKDVKKEIDKCIILCANCHRLLHKK